MKRFFGALCFVAVFSLFAPARADDAKVNEILDKAIKALGGEEKIGKAEAMTWKAKGKITIEGNENEFTAGATLQGLDRLHAEFEMEINGNKFKAISVLDGDKGWRKLGDQVMEMDKDSVTNEKRNAYLMAAATLVAPLKGKGFKVEAAGEEKIAGKPALGVKATGSDGKDFTLYFDKESGLPVRMVAKVIGWMGEEYTQEINYSNHKEFEGLKRPTKVSVKRDGDPFLDEEVVEFKVLDKVPAETFAELK
jgi:hypothetical protein